MEELQRENARLKALLAEKQEQQERLRSEVKQQLKDLLKEKEALSQEKKAVEHEIAVLQQRKREKLANGGDVTDL